MEGILAPWHWIIIIGVVLLIFGPKKLPELGNSLGKGISGFRRGMKDVQDEVSTSVSMSAAEAPETTRPAEIVRTPVLTETCAEASREESTQA